MYKTSKEILQYSSIFDLPHDTIEEIKRNLEFKTFKKKEVFITSGELQEKFFFLSSGIARAYMRDETGREFTRTLFSAPTAMIALKAVITNSPSKINFDCLTDCEMYVGDFDTFVNLTKSNIHISNTYSRMLEKAFLRVEQRVFEMSLPAKEKYEKLRKRIPNIDNLIPQYQIASYLGITPVQLSRIRNR